MRISVNFSPTNQQPSFLTQTAMIQCRFWHSALWQEMKSDTATMENDGVASVWTLQSDLSGPDHIDIELIRRGSLGLVHTWCIWTCFLISVSGYKAVAGDCGGNDIKGVRGSRAECAAACSQLAECVGWGYVEAGTRPWPHAPCFLKRKLCAKPKAVKGLSITTYFKTAAEGQFFHHSLDLTCF